MRTSAANVWAAGDVAQARGFWGDKVLNGILPNAVEQGRIAGLDMADDADVQPFPGAVPLNTYSFFGQQAISVGRAHNGDGIDIKESGDDAKGVYRRIALKDGKLVGIATINDFIDAGIMWQLILRGTDLSRGQGQVRGQSHAHRATVDVAALALGARHGRMFQHPAIPPRALRRLHRLHDRLRAGQGRHRRPAVRAHPHHARRQ